MHRTTLGELMSCTADGKRLVAHAADTGEPVHIFNALSGLACNCICPGCERRMVAHRGSRRQHFQHEARIEGRTCISSGETALHKFAKTVLGRELVLMLSALDETDGPHTVHVVREGRFEFEKAILECRQGEVVPDVICRIGDRDLHVEFKVTHPCGSEKIAKLKEMDVGAIEIDLSGCRDRPLDELAHAILFEAPRIWLHNPKAAKARSKLAEMESERQDRIDSEARGLLAAYKAEAVDLSEIGVWEDGAVNHGLAAAVAGGGADIRGFLVRDAEWKAFVLLQMGAGEKKGFTQKNALAAMKAEGWVSRDFAFVREELADRMRELEGSTLRVPWEALGDYMKAMERERYLIPAGAFGKRVKRGSRLLEAIAAAKELKERPERRTEDLKGLVHAVLAFVREQYREGFVFEDWFERRAGPEGICPADAIHLDEADWERFIQPIKKLRTDLWARPPSISEACGLPVEEEVAERQAAHRRTEEKRAAEARHREDEEANAREAEVGKVARAIMGTEATTWMSMPLEGLAGRSPAETARRSNDGIGRVIAALDRWRDERAADTHRLDQREQSLSKLRNAARESFGRSDFADLWIRQPCKGLAGKRPEDICVDGRSLEKCLEFLPGKKTRRA
ncbi:MAG: DUF2384 domain-containing protein [Mesorhizobium sp.]|nr:MAG: DUF2384 domain-containing protein [Mesorhizobium sp.]